MAAREESPGASPRAHRVSTPAAKPPTLVELRDVNERLLIAGLREQELAAALAVERATLVAERATLVAERARLTVILAAMGDAVLVVDPHGAIIRTNAAYARMAGGTEISLAPQDAHGHALPPADAPQARAGRGETFSQEFTLAGADGSRRWYEANGQPLHDRSAGHAVVVIRDITASRAQRRLQDEFLSLASHELRTPLTLIQGYVDLLLARVRRTSDDERLIRYVTQARGQLRQLTALVGDLTDVARLQSGKLTLVLAPVELGAVVARVVETARDLPPGPTIHLAATPDPLWMAGDVGRLEQILVNLLTNAVAHAPSATPIDVRLRRVGAEAVLEVQDYGQGIAADQLPHLFTRFYQVAHPDRPSRGGLGLGLFICQEVVTAHGGRIAVASMEGEGTTFTVWLPLTETAGGARGTPAV